MKIFLWEVGEKLRSYRYLRYPERYNGCDLCGMLRMHFVSFSSVRIVVLRSFQFLIVVVVMAETKKTKGFASLARGSIHESQRQLLRSSTRARGLFDEEPMVDNADVGAAAR